MSIWRRTGSNPNSGGTADRIDVPACRSFCFAYFRDDWRVQKRRRYRALVGCSGLWREMQPLAILTIHDVLKGSFTPPDRRASILTDSNGFIAATSRWRRARQKRTDSRTLAAE
jgi:hypothetical protein